MRTGTRGRPLRTDLAVARVVIGAQRVRRAQPRGFEGLVDEPAKPVRCPRETSPPRVPSLSGAAV